MVETPMAFHLYHLGTEHRQKKRGVWPGPRPGEIDYPYSIQRVLFHVPLYKLDDTLFFQLGQLFFTATQALPVDTIVVLTEKGGGAIRPPRRF